MSATLVESAVSARRTGAEAGPSEASRWIVPAVVLVALLAANAPLFLCMPLTNDTVLYDLQANKLMQGGVLYRDLFETNLPGVVWIHAGVRSLAGWSSEAMRGFDLALFAISVSLLSAAVGVERRSRRAGLWAAALLFWFYFSVSEWCHCQRDVWLLPCAIGGLWLRSRQVARVRAGGSWRTVGLWGFVEGVCWACGFWIKPHIAVAAVACWVTSALLVRWPKPLLFDFAGLIAGGAAVGAAGLFWMWNSGAWPYFLETFVEWNPRYVRAGREHWTFARFLGMGIRMFPWLLAHAAALPIGASWVIRAWRRNPENAGGCKPILAAMYLAWVAQAFFLQHLFDYVHAPGIVLAIAVIIAARPVGRVLRAAAVAFLIAAAATSPAIRLDRLVCWNECLAQGSSPEVRDRLTHFESPNWRNLEVVCEFLRGLDLQDGELTVYSNSLIDVYPHLGFMPSTRYAYLESLITFFPEKHAVFREALEQSRQKYVVTDLLGSGLTAAEAAEIGPEGPRGAPPALVRRLKTGRFRGTFPWDQPVVFRSGTILVHQVVEPLGRFVNEPAVPRNRTAHP